VGSAYSHKPVQFSATECEAICDWARAVNGVVLPLTVVPTAKVLGRGTAGTGAMEYLALSSDFGLSFVYSANALKLNFKAGVQSIPTAAGTTVGSAIDHVMVFTGITTQTYTLPPCTTGREIWVKNQSTGAVTVNRAGADTIDGGTTLNLATTTSTRLIGNGTDWVVF
jgi:hypothetical protein